MNQATSTVVMAAAASVVNQCQGADKQLGKNEPICDKNIQKVFDDMSMQECQENFSFEKSGLH